MKKTKTTKKVIKVQKKEPVVEAHKKVKLVSPHIPNMKAEEKIEWEAPEFIYHEKDIYWVVGVGVLTLGLAGLLFYLGEYLLMVIAIITFVIFYQFGHKEPQRKKIILDSEGILFRGQRYSYHRLKSFWVVEEPQGLVYFEQAGIGQHITILLNDKSASKVRAFLQRYVPEHPIGGEQLTEKLSRFFRF